MPSSKWLLLGLLVGCGDKDTDTETEDSDNVGLYPDRDGDGYTEDVDCDDSNPNINPGATEQCNSADDNCDGQIDEGVMGTFYPDADKDGFGNDASPISLCNIQPGLIEDGGDCNDADASINPNGTEICDGQDNNCDDQIDEGTIVTLYRDEDGDGYGQDGTGVEGCPNGTDAEAGGDCNDFDAAQYPGAREICGDGIVNDCDATESDAIASCTGELEGGIVAGLAYAFVGAESGSYAGYAVGSAGDVDGDGDDEILVGAPNASSAGAAYLITAGTAEGSVDDVAVATITGVTSKSGFGATLEGVGDLDGDGFDDIVITAYGSDEGALFYGPVSGSLSSSDADAQFITDKVSGVYGGYSVSDAGDLDGDGAADLLFGAPLVSEYDQYSGAAIVAYGPFDDGGTGTISAMLGETYFAQVGWSVAGVGDVNGDGIADALTGGRYAGIGTEDGLEYPGEAYLFFGPIEQNSQLDASDAGVQFTASNQFDLGGQVVRHAGDVNNDGYQDILISEDNQDTAGRIALFLGASHMGTAQRLDDSDASFVGESTDGFAVAVNPMGDANGDGYEDLVIGAYGADEGYGAAYLVFGPFSGEVSLASSGLKVMGDTSGFLGYSVSSAGDFDGDGLTDFLAGAPEANGNGTAYVVPRVGTGEY